MDYIGDEEAPIRLYSGEFTAAARITLHGKLGPAVFQAATEWYT